MIYDFHLYFTGLCLFYFPEADRPNGDSSAKVLLVNATDPDGHFDDLSKIDRPHEHVPRLVVDPFFLRSNKQDARTADGLAVGPDGEDSALFDIAGQELTVVIPEQTGLEIPRGRKPASKDPFSDPAEQGARPDWFDWTISVPSVSDTGTAKVTKLKDACLTGTLDQTNPVSTRITLEGGKLETFSHSRNDGRRAVYQYLCLDGSTPSSEDPHVFADRVVLKAEGISSEKQVQLKTSTEVVYLGPPDDDDERRLIRASITNLDTSYKSPRHPLSDFLWYYRLYEWSPCEPSLYKMPVPTQAVWATQAYFTPSSTTCPPGSG